MKIIHLRKKRGFTLIELLMVITVLSILMTALVVSLRNSNIEGKANLFQLKNAKTQLEVALFQYRQLVGQYPNTLQDLIEAPPDVSPEQFPLIDKKFLMDPWKKLYQYELKSSGDYEIFTLGRDGQVGGEGANSDIYFSKLE